MLRVHISLDAAGGLRRMRFEGHMGKFPAGHNPACAAATALARTTARLLDSRKGWRVRGRAPEPGKLNLNIESYPPEERDWLCGVTDVLLRGLRDIAGEYPEELSMKVKEG